MCPPDDNYSELKSLVLSAWFQRPEDASIWLRIYSSLHTPPDTLAKLVKGWGEAAGGESRLSALTGRVLLGAGTIQDFKAPFVRTDIHSEATGRVVVKFEPELRSLPPGGYVFLVVPYRDGPTPGVESAAKQTLDTFATLLCIHAGRNFMWRCVFEGEVSGKDGSFTAPSPSIKLPQPTDGPYLTAQSAGEFSEISVSLRETAEPRRGRLNLALRIMDNAIRKDEGFFEYWTALEVLCDGKGGRIKERFARAYGLRNHAEAARLGGLEVLSRWRGDYVHKGKTPLVSTDIERYLQLLFLDLLRYELSLPLRSHALSMQRTEGVDLSPIGLPDNRSDEQKQAKEAALRGSQQPETTGH